MKGLVVSLCDTLLYQNLFMSTVSQTQNPTQTSTQFGTGPSGGMYGT
jgi:hypothetical protein